MCRQGFWLFFCVDNEPIGCMHVNMLIQTFGEYPSPSDEVTRGWADVVSIYTNNELIGCMHVNMLIQTFGEYPSPSDEVTRGWADVVSIYTNNEPIGCMQRSCVYTSLVSCSFLLIVFITIFLFPLHIGSTRSFFGPSPVSRWIMVSFGRIRMQLIRTSIYSSRLII